MIIAMIDDIEVDDLLAIQTCAGVGRRPQFSHPKFEIMEINQQALTTFVNDMIDECCFHEDVFKTQETYYFISTTGKLLVAATAKWPMDTNYYVLSI